MFPSFFTDEAARDRAPDEPAARGSMYQDHFGLYTAPFVLGPRLQFVYKSKTFEETMAHLIYGIEGGEEIILITGAIGTGKTLALRNLTSHIAAGYQVALINVTQLDFRELMKLLLVELDVTPAQGADRADLLSALQIRLKALAAEGRRCLLVVDEAQNLDRDTLEGVRLLTNLGTEETHALQVVLSGQPALREAVEHPDLLQLRQRIRVHYHLTNLDEGETREYVEHRLKVAGADRTIFRPDAIRQIHRLSRGVPRLINILADKALLSAYVDGAKEVGAKHVEEDASLVISPEPQTQRAQRGAEAAEPAPPRPAPTPPAPPPSAAPVRPAAEPEPPRRGSSRRLWWIVVPLLLVAAGLIWFASQRGWFRTDAAGADRAPATSTLTPPVSAEAAPPPLAADAAETAPAQDLTTPAAPDSTAVAEPAPQTTDDADEPAAVVAAVDSTAAHPDIDGPLDEGIYIHIGSFRSLSRAQEYVGIVGRRGLDAFLKRVQLSGETWYRVYLGSFDDYESADAVDARLHRDNLSAWSMVVRIR